MSQVSLKRNDAVKSPFQIQMKLVGILPLRVFILLSSTILVGSLRIRNIQRGIRNLTLYKKILFKTLKAIGKFYKQITIENLKLLL